jgi:hypothetical protein
MKMNRKVDEKGILLPGESDDVTLEPENGVDQFILKQMYYIMLENTQLKAMLLRDN